MKKILALVLSMLMLSACLFSCGSTGDLAAIKENGKMVIGITLYEPMNYYAEDGETLIGFDTEFAEALCAELGVKAEFQIIDWKMKETELKSGNIDAIWNGLTVTEERKENMGFTTPYLTNEQCIVIKADKADVYVDTASLAGALIAAEAGSAGESAVAADENLSKATYVGADTQAAALLELKAGNVDAIVVDHSMATASVGSGDYADMVIVDSIDLTDELYAIGFRVGSDLIEEANDIIAKFIEDGTLEAIAEKYGRLEQYKAAVNG
ncbi:MAG: transporter substrate-binding domain-containing protein [Clostridia bacterium]|nr:transporter substrate-binding domain-containing protein [Clostridia bacterium]